MLGINWSHSPKSQLLTEGSDQDQNTAQDAMCYENYYSDGMEYLEM
jgi:hypothetical protein